MMHKKKVIEMLENAGFNLYGFAKPKIDESIKSKFMDWIKDKKYAGMKWMEETKDIRTEPSKLLPGVKTVIAVAIPYIKKKENKYFALYAHSKDYHYIFRKMMKRFAIEFAKEFPNEKILFANDTKPLFERYFAWKAGLGFIGKNTMLITKEYGSYVILGAFLTTMEITPDEEGKGTCGTCTRCIDSCPTQALSPYQLNANRCIAYWTIEHKGEIPEDIKLDGKLFGCDICQEVCPYNKTAIIKHKKNPLNPLSRIRIRKEITPEKILNMTEKEFRETFKGTPVMRAGYEGMIRNAKKANKN